MQLDWSKLRVLNRTQQSSFEILCCQLADADAAADGAKLIRKAAPDGGVECFYAYADGSERAFQAKFFRDVPDEGQWKQLDKSVQRALKTHPLLARYVICLPRDREDPRVPGQQWFMDKWKVREAKWETWARDAGKDVTFEYWGEHEIVSRLSRDEHRGRRFFWFDEEAFTRAWFEERLAVAVADAGARYKPELNIDLPIAQVFSGLGRDASFQACLTSPGAMFVTTRSRRRSPRQG